MRKNLLKLSTLGSVMSIKTYQLVLFYFLIWLDVPHLTHKHMHKTASLADEGNSAYFQSSGGAHNIKYINLWKLELRGHLNTDAQARIELVTY